MKRARATIRIDLTDTNTDTDTDVEPEIVARAVAPDNTPQMTSWLEGETLETRIERDSVGGLRSTIDDYVVNLGVAKRVAAIGNPPDTDDERDGGEHDS